MAEILRDIRYAARNLWRNPGFAMVAVATIALGIGASTTVFSVVYGVLLKPLPYRDSERLAIIEAEQTFEGARRPVRAYFPFAAIGAWPRTVSSLESIAFYSENTAALAGTVGSEPVDIAAVSDSFFSVVRGEFALGRPMTASEGNLPVVVISNRLWQRLYSGAPDIIGRQLTLNAQSLTIVGVADSTFQLPTPQTEAWIPAASRPNGVYTPIARLAPGATVERVTADVTLIANELAVEMPRFLRGVRVKAVGLQDYFVRTARPALLLLMAAVVLLLVLACANVMNLLLARGVSRSFETAVRRALGASPGRLIQQSLTESGVVTAIGTAAGIALAGISLQSLKVWTSPGVPQFDAVRIDPAVLLFACVAAIVTIVTVSLAPVLTRPNVALTMRAGQRGLLGSLRTRSVLRTITVVQLAISVMLLIGAMLLGRSLIALMRTELGVISEGVATASLNLTLDRQLNGDQQAGLIHRVLDRVRAMPDVTAAGAGTSRPPNANRMRLTLNRAGGTFQAAAVPATPGYFEALGIRIERGRLFTDNDAATAPQVVIMSAYTAGLLFGEQDPVGRTIALPVLRNGVTRNTEMTIVGITANVKYAGLDQMPDAVVYRPFAQQPWPTTFLVVRTKGDPSAVVSQLQREIGAVDRAIAVSEVMTLDSIIREAAAQPRFRTLLLITFASIAISIAAVGLYGVMAYSVTNRTGEIGIRMALGADRRRIMTMILREGLLLALVGNLIGLAGAYAATRILGSLLYGISPRDATTFSVAALGLILVAAAASYMPASRAARIDPLTALKAD